MSYADHRLPGPDEEPPGEQGRVERGLPGGRLRPDLVAVLVQRGQSGLPVVRGPLLDERPARLRVRAEDVQVGAGSSSFRPDGLAVLGGDQHQGRSLRAVRERLRVEQPELLAPAHQQGLVAHVAEEVARAGVDAARPVLRAVRAGEPDEPLLVALARTHHRDAFVGKDLRRERVAALHARALEGGAPLALAGLSREPDQVGGGTSWQRRNQVAAVARVVRRLRGAHRDAPHRSQLLVVEHREVGVVVACGPRCPARTPRPAPTARSGTRPRPAPPRTEEAPPAWPRPACPGRGPAARPAAPRRGTARSTAMPGGSPRTRRSRDPAWWPQRHLRRPGRPPPPPDRSPNAVCSRGSA